MEILMELWWLIFSLGLVVAGSYGKELEGDCDLISGVDLVLLYFCGWVIYDNIYDIFGG